MFSNDTYINNIFFFSLVLLRFNRLRLNVNVLRLIVVIGLIRLHLVYFHINFPFLGEMIQLLMTIDVVSSMTDIYS